ncbi:hypothetical protein [Anaerotruncus sp. 1XD42-93]|uniref:hypothetical protein n=1 Tax=Anaerotruncus sp. 1XD42-93 TaxID=2320853 RepID=UPI000EA05F25|nr:hypothetical protein [Anaerotruncus sp. 1XD42-93]NBI58649.1 hypothetical protein [Lachnospiraceae bacterium]NBK19091.1 hypothetical protein [Anaerotruncus sp. 1XD42-93]RKJ49973.1 hypothetical protein D7X25_18780 [bacterium 1XD42-8]RKJ82778.1 hypothetical protein D7Y41_23210 [Anaerotruncus sp. 1XD22-93]
MLRKRLKTGLLILSLSLFLTACNGGETVTEDNAVSSSKSETQSDTDLPEYAFAINGYVEIQEGEIDSIHVTDYLPDKAMTLLYKDMTIESGSQYYYNLYPNEENVQYEGVSDIDIIANYGGGNNQTSTGYYYYDTKADCLAEVSNRTLTDIAYLIPMGKSLEIKDGATIQNLPYLFTITCEAGIYEDCVAVIETVDFSTSNENKEIATVTYYAKGIGKILTVSNYRNGGLDFFVTDILLEITDLKEDTNDSEEYTEESYFTFPFSTGQQLECFETETGEDVIITIDIQNDTPYIIFPEAVWVELEVNGKGDSWEFINPYFTEERVYTTVSIQDNEITISTNETFMYDGTYIQLPDIGTDGE